jgi:plasmid maintenance system antidote protein VapI
MDEPNLSTFISGRRALTPWMAWEFARVLRTKPQYWMTLQGEFDLWQARPRRAARKAPKPRRRR